MKFILILISLLLCVGCSVTLFDTVALEQRQAPSGDQNANANTAIEPPSQLLYKWLNLYPKKSDTSATATDGNAQSIYLYDLIKSSNEFKSIRVKMFPVNPPFGDPYPKTENIWAYAMSNKEGLNVRSAVDGTEILNYTTMIVFNFKNKTFKANGRKFKLLELIVTPVTNRPTNLTWDKDLFSQMDLTLRGSFTVKPIIDEKSKWQVINIVSLEEYVASATSSEAIHHFEFEALKAQAIAIRTYVLHEMIRARIERKREWDVTPTTTFQSYRGVKWHHTLQGWQEVENDVARKATEQTESQIILYDNKIIKSYFHSNSGGKTCSAKECLNTKDNQPYLQAVKDAGGVRNAPMGTWGKMKPLNLAQVHEILKTYKIGKNASKLTKLIPIRKSSSGRIFQFRAQFSNGKTTLLTQEQSEKIMKLFGSIRSYYFELSEPDNKGFQYVSGFGYGHGVGLSQWGAHLYAKKGWDANKIITYYFPGTIVKPIIN